MRLFCSYHYSLQNTVARGIYVQLTDKPRNIGLIYPIDLNVNAFKYLLHVALCTHFINATATEVFGISSKSNLYNYTISLLSKIRMS